LPKNRNFKKKNAFFNQKSKFWPKIEIYAKNWKFGQALVNLRQKSHKKTHFWSSPHFFSILLKL